MQSLYQSWNEIRRDSWEVIEILFSEVEVGVNCQLVSAEICE